MNATKTDQNLEHRLTVNRSELAQILGMGLDSAQRIGEEAGAVVRVGRLKRYNVQKVREYVNRISGEG